MKKSVLFVIFTFSAVFGMTGSFNSGNNFIGANSTPVYKKIKLKNIKCSPTRNTVFSSVNNSISGNTETVNNAFVTANFGPVSTQQNVHVAVPSQNYLYNINSIYNGIQPQWNEHYYKSTVNAKDQRSVFIPVYRKVAYNFVSSKKSLQNVKSDSLKRKREKEENENLYKYINQKYEEADQKLKDVETEFNNIQKKYENELNEKDIEINDIRMKYNTEISKKERYKKEITHLNQELILINQLLKKEQQKSDELIKANKLQDNILWAEKRWQNIINPLMTASTTNKNLRKYILLLMNNNVALTLVNSGTSFEEIARQLTSDLDIDTHLQKLENDHYFWTQSDTSKGEFVFRKAFEYNEELLEKINDRNSRAKARLEKICRDNEALTSIVQKLHKSEEISRYVSNEIKRIHPELFSIVTGYLNKSNCRENY